MDLKLKHLPLILMGGLFGAGLGWGAQWGLMTLDLLDLDALTGVDGAGWIFGGTAGMALAVVTIVVRAARDPDAAPASNFTQLNGMGSSFIGRAEPREDESYVTTEWFTLLWIPIFPVCRYRLIEHKQARRLFYREYTIIEKFPARGADVVKVYGLEVTALIVLVGIGYLATR